MTLMQTPILSSAEHDATSALAMLRELEHSLLASQEPLLSSDITGLEVETARQIRLLHQINGQIDKLTGDPKAIAKLQAVCARVWHLGQVQSALLARASRRLRMIANVMAGPQAAYAENASRFGAQSPTAFSGATVLNGENPCRA